jgi:putative transposase
MIIYKRHRFPPEIIQYAVWLYYRFNLSFRDIEDLLHERGIEVSYEAIRLWCNKFGPEYARHLKKKRHGFGDTFYIDEVFVKINGVQHYLWRAVDQDGDVIDVYLQKRRDSKTAKRFFKRLLKAHQGQPWKILTDKMGSYRVAHKELMPDVIHDTSQYANNKAELSHQPTRVRERVMRKFKSTEQGQRFLSVHSEVYNLFNLGRHCISAKNYKMLRSRAIASWIDVVAV